MRDPNTEYDTVDPFYVTITLLSAFGTHLFALLAVYTLKRKNNAHPSILTDDIIPALVSTGTVAFLALLTYGLVDTRFARQIVVLGLVLAWAVRMGVYRVVRALKFGPDPRMARMPARFWPLAGFWTYQWFWVFLISLPVTFINSAYIAGREGGGNVPFGSAKDIIGIVLWAVGFALETTADSLKYYWKSGSHKHPRGAIINLGPWAWSRRPNYFGEILRQALLSGAASPVFTFLIIMFATGIPLAEKPTQRRAFLASTGDHSASSGSGGSDGQELLAYQNQHESDPWLRYKAFRERTSLLIPIPPALYHHLPGFVKQSVLLDRPIYRFDETRDGSRAIQEAREKKEQLV
ncbi:hypothetical protein V8E36_001168 [Tilletia maclaganii]